MFFSFSRPQALSTTSKVEPAHQAQRSFELVRRLQETENDSPSYSSLNDIFSEMIDDQYPMSLSKWETIPG
jgi:hypothetical protein